MTYWKQVLGFMVIVKDLMYTGLGLVKIMKVGFPLHFQWYQNRQRIEERCIFDLKNGDIYSMSKKGTGYDWKKSANNRLTLRHAAGCGKYLK
tara:strand:- start:136 stop:411 length:276 start_codon:yes stop_codon:yes gene_type:complete